MECFDDIFGTFLDFESFMTLADYRRVRQLSDFIQNILICVPKMNKGLTGLEQHEGE